MNELYNDKNEELENTSNNGTLNQLLSIKPKSVVERLKQVPKDIAKGTIQGSAAAPLSIVDLPANILNTGDLLNRQENANKLSKILEYEKNTSEDKIKSLERDFIRNKKLSPELIENWRNKAEKNRLKNYFEKDFKLYPTAKEFIYEKVLPKNVKDFLTPSNKVEEFVNDVIEYAAPAALNPIGTLPKTASKYGLKFASQTAAKKLGIALAESAAFKATSEGLNATNASQATKTLLPMVASLSTGLYFNNTHQDLKNMASGLYEYGKENAIKAVEKSTEKFGNVFGGILKEYTELPSSTALTTENQIKQSILINSIKKSKRMPGSKKQDLIRSITSQTKPDISKPSIADIKQTSIGQTLLSYEELNDMKRYMVNLKPDFVLKDFGSIKLNNADYKVINKNISKKLIDNVDISKYNNEANKLLQNVSNEMPKNIKSAKDYKVKFTEILNKELESTIEEESIKSRIKTLKKKNPAVAKTVESYKNLSDRKEILDKLNVKDEIKSNKYKAAERLKNKDLSNAIDKTWNKLDKERQVNKINNIRKQQIQNIDNSISKITDNGSFIPRSTTVDARKAMPSLSGIIAASEEGITKEQKEMKGIIKGILDVTEKTNLPGKLEKLELDKVVSLKQALSRRIGKILKGEETRDSNSFKAQLKKLHYELNDILDKRFMDSHPTIVKQVRQADSMYRALEQGNEVKRFFEKVPFLGEKYYKYIDAYAAAKLFFHGNPKPILLKGLGKLSTNIATAPLSIFRKMMTDSIVAKSYARTIVALSSDALSMDAKKRAAIAFGTTILKRKDKLDLPVIKFRRKANKEQEESLNTNNIENREPVIKFRRRAGANP